MEVLISSNKPMDGTNMVFSQMFSTLRTARREGDRFYVPGHKMLVVLSNAVEVSGRKEPLMVGQHFPVVKLDDDNKPVEVTELYVGQVVKVDAHGKVVFPNELSAALRKSGDAFAGAICGNVLVVGAPVEIDDRVWDDEHKVWARGTFDADSGKWIYSEKPGDRRYPYVTRKVLAFPFKAQGASKNLDVNACNEMLKAYYDENNYKL